MSARGIFCRFLRLPFLLCIAAAGMAAVWVKPWPGPGAPLRAGARPAALNHPPDLPGQPSPPNGSRVDGASTLLSARVSDPDGDDLEVAFYVRPLSFTLAHIPDTQRDLANGMFAEITTWIVGHRVEQRIEYAVQVGDITEGDTPTEWDQASAAAAVLEDPLTTGLPDGLPYGILRGNHDSVSGFEATFGAARFEGRAYYTGHYPSGSNLNSYSLFSAGGLDFIAIQLSDCPLPDALDWADALLQAAPARWGIVSTHTIFPWLVGPEWHPCGQAIFEALSDNPNFFLFLGGHSRTETMRQDAGASGATVFTLVADYTDLMNGNFRLVEFSPGENLIHVRTYSPHLDRYETDAGSQFDLAWEMSGAGFGVLSTIPDVPSGTTAAWELDDLVDGTRVQWYLTVSDGVQTTTGPVWEFQVGDPGTQPTPTLTPTPTPTRTPTLTPTRTPTPLPGGWDRFRQYIPVARH